MKFVLLIKLSPIFYWLSIKFLLQVSHNRISKVQDWFSDFCVQRLLHGTYKTEGNLSTSIYNEKRVTLHPWKLLHRCVLLTVCAVPANTQLGDQQHPLGYEDECKRSNHLLLLGYREQWNLLKVKDASLNRCLLNLSSLACSYSCFYTICSSGGRKDQIDFLSSQRNVQINCNKVKEIVLFCNKTICLMLGKDGDLRSTA